MDPLIKFPDRKLLTNCLKGISGKRHCLKYVRLTDRANRDLMRVFQSSLSHLATNRLLGSWRIFAQES